MFVRAFVAALAFSFTASSLFAADEENPIVTLVKSKVKDKSKPFSMLVTLKVKAGQEKALEEAFGPCVAATRKEPGCVAYQLNRDLDHPNVYVMFEHFKSVPAIEEHAKSKHVAALLEKILPLLEAPPEAKILGVIGE